MQTKQNNPAAGTTIAEFEWILKKFQGVAEADAEKHKHLLQDPTQWKPIYSFDRASIHNVHKACAALGCTAEGITPLPHYAPDFQKPVEHVFGYCKAAFRKRLAIIGTTLPMKEYANHFLDIFFSIKPESVKKDIESLPTTYNNILAPLSAGGSNGGYAVKGFN